MNKIQMEEYTRQRLEQEIDLMKQAIESYQRNAHQGQDSSSLIYDCEIRIFNAAVNLGNFDLAYDYAKTTDDKKLLTRLMMSFIRDENDSCKCVPDVMPGEVEIPLFFAQRRIYNPRLAAWIDVYKCSKCNFMTAHNNAVCTQHARNVQRIKARPENKNAKKPMQDHEVFKK